ncbi:MAG: hypothetical protein HW391_2109 [Chloroflexi bacterium]|nr:hypothetical protein [Chloroflexota bacterium]
MLGGHRRHEAMEAGLAGELRMERCGHDVPLADGHDPTVVQRREDVHARPGPLDDRCPNEHAVDGLIAKDRDAQIRLEGVELPTEGVAPDIDVEQWEDRLVAVQDPARQEDHPGAGAEHRRAGTSQFEDRLAQPPAVDQEALGRGLPARQDETADPLEIGRTAHGNALDADGVECGEMFGERPLDGEDPDPHRCHPAVAGAVTITNLERPADPTRRAVPSRCRASARRGPC